MMRSMQRYLGRKASRRVSIMAQADARRRSEGITILPPSHSEVTIEEEEEDWYSPVATLHPPARHDEDRLSARSAASLLRRGASPDGRLEEEGRGEVAKEEEKEAKTCKNWFKDVYEQLGLKHALPILALVLYSLIGAGIFYVIEEPTTKTLSRDCQAKANYARRQVEERMWELHLENYSQANKQWVMRHAVAAMDWYEGQREVCDSSKYILDFWSAMFYCGTIYTTIVGGSTSGYGTIVPITTAGKIVTMLYSVIGIPLVFIILNSFGDFMSKKIILVWFWTLDLLVKAKKNLRKVFRLRRIKRKIQNGEFKDEVQEELSDDSPAPSEGEKQLHELPIVVALGLTFGWMLVCAAIFCLWEEWSYFLSFYFFFVSLTTIGLGDLVPERYDLMMLMFWAILVGLSLVSMCIQVAQAKVENFVEMTLLKNFKDLQEAQMAEATGIVTGVVGLSPARIDGPRPPGPDGDAGDPTTREPLAAGLASPRNIGDEPEWVKAILGSRGRKRLEKQWNKKAAAKVKGIQTTPEEHQTEQECQTDPMTDWNSIIKEQREQIASLLAKTRFLQQQLEAFQTAADSSNQLSLDSVALVHKHQNGSVRPASQLVPYREFVHKSSKSPSLDHGRELLDELSFRIQECRSLVSNR